MILPQRFLLTILSLILIVGVESAKAEGACARNTVELQSNEQLAAIEQQFGGISAVFGSWKLGGIAGAIENVQIDIRETGSTFWIRVTGDDWRRAEFCTEETGKVIVVNIIDPLPGYDRIFARPGGANKMQIAGPPSHWKFMTFKKFAPRIPKIEMASLGN